MISIASLKTHVESYVAEVAAEVDGPLHTMLKKFAEFVEGKEAVADATALLVSKGYTVTPPPQA